ncbi:ATP-binding protein [Paraburkholderia kirstenboschensis]|uniref:histidine kinase n=1 Tax=Paraburkholderia kirstenboschensis TaxID=1245436 RepID=A0ABZ0EIE2_9BURK|nr:ATP-binding protein [Paraburkholderia kirstenboschensis]WOD16981.1 PAS domain S-box protein [Paraburkholderia kirstenboschensis]
MRYLMALWLAGCIALGAVTASCVLLDQEESTAGFFLLVAVVLLSLLDSFISSVIFSVVGAALLNYFFTEPINSFGISNTADLFSLVAFLVTSLAITTLVRRIGRIEKTQRAQAQLLELTHDIIIVRDKNDVITYWNQAAESLYGWKKEEAMGKFIDELLRSVFPLPRDQLQQIYVRDGQWEGELIHTRRDGTEIIVTSRWALQRDGAGNPLATLETNNDITERRRAEDLLRKSQAQYFAEAQKLSRTGSFGWNFSSGEVFWSEQTFSIFEYDPAVAPTIELVRQRMHPEDIRVLEELLAQASGSSADFDIEHRLLFPDGRTKHLRVVAHATNDQPNNRLLIGAVMDVTGAKQTEERLRHAQSELERVSRVTALGELSASIAHEVGQPLSAIVTNGEACLRWLHRQPPDMEEIEGCVRQMTDQANRAAEIVQRVRALMKGAPPDRAPIAINDVVEEAIAVITRDIERQCGLLTRRLASGLPLILGDRVQLQQVLVNLITNAMQSMASVSGRRELIVQSRLDPEGNVVVAIKDSGAGIQEANLPQLFEPFFTTRSSGMGMGLAISSSIVDAHRGQIWASNNPEGGATFSFSLPPAMTQEVVRK